MSMVSFLSCGCSDQAGASEGMWVPGAPIVFRWFRSEVALKWPPLADAYQGVIIRESG
jgi:hypothetical protein